MAIKIQFDQARTPETPTLVLAKRNGDKIGQINATNISLTDFYNDASEIQFDVHKDMNTFEEPPSGEKYNDSAYASVFTLGRSILGNTENSFTWDAPNIWEELVDLRLVWCKEWDMWFQITVSVSETDDLVKTVSCVELGPAELSQIMLYNIEINTETDISRDDYTEPTVFWNPTHPEASLLHRLMENVPHYTIQYVEGTIENIQRTFTFDSESIYDAFQEIAEEIGCIFIFHSGSDSDGNIQRSISVYDLYSNCIDCGYRGEFTDQCPECGGTDINEGYGEDTTIFITSDSLSDEIDYATNVSDIKNCFKLEAGDDLMTATVRNCNPNGSDRIWRWNSNMVADMTEDLVNKLNEYNELYDYYQNEYQIKRLTQEVCDAYNEVVKTYRSYDPSLGTIDYPVIGYPALMEAYYNTIDLVLYLQSGLMPSVSLSDTTAQEQAGLLIRRSLSPVAVSNINTVSLATANSAVLAVAKCIVRNTYQVKVNESSLSGTTWTGTFIVTNYSDEEDTAVSDPVTVDISDDYETYLKQCIQKTINSEDGEDYSITSLFDKSYDGFCIALKEYCLDWLNTFRDACQACLNILIEQGIADRETWSQGDPNLYDDLYLPYYEKFCAIEAEMKVREDEINTITGVTDEDGDITLYGTQTYIEEENAEIQDILDFEKYLGEDLWKELSAFRREDKFTNSNYISDGLNNAEIFTKAQEFIEVAKVELYKSSELQHSITATLNNLLAIDAFAPLVDYFEVGNWLRIRVDERVYKLRLVSYGIDYEDLSTLTIEFSDVIKIPGGMSDVQSIMNRASSISSSYGYTQHQADQGASGRRTVQNWVTNGLDLTNMRIISSADNQDQYWDEYGILLRKYNSITDMYEDTQMKIVNSTIAITDDAWRTIRTAVGNFYYVDPNTGDIVSAYGVNAETLVGKVILGEGLGIYTTDGSLTFDENGLIIDTSGGIAFTIENNGERQLYIDSNGNLVLGNGASIMWGNIDLTDLILSVDNIYTYDENGERTDLMKYINAQFAYIEKLTVDSIDALTAQIGELAVEYIEAKEGHFGLLFADEAYELFATIENLNAVYATIDELHTIYASIEALEAVSITVDDLDALVANIGSLLAGNEVAGEITTIVLNASNVTIGEGFIEKLLAGTILADMIDVDYINTDVITISSEDGGVTFIGNQMQFTNGQIIFYDDDGNVRLQIGQDATGNFTFELYAADGSGVMIDENGIHESAISDGLIVDKMVADDAAIQGSKLDIASVAECLNEDGSLTMKASSVYIGDEGLDIYLTQMQQQIDSIDPSEYEKYGIMNVIDWFCINYSDTEPPVDPEETRAYADVFVLGQSILGKVYTTETPNILSYYEGMNEDSEIGATVIEFGLTNRGKQFASNKTATFSFEYKSTVGDTAIITFNLDGNKFTQEFSDDTGEWIQYSYTFEIGELTDDPYINLDGSTDRRLRDYIFRNFRLEAEGVPGDNEWTTDRLTAEEGQYLWWVKEYIFYEGKIIWGTPVCLTDGYVRNQTTTLIQDFEVMDGYVKSLIEQVTTINYDIYDENGLVGTQISQITTNYNLFYQDYQETISMIGEDIATVEGSVTKLETTVTTVEQTFNTWSVTVDQSLETLTNGYDYCYTNITQLLVDTGEITGRITNVETLLDDAETLISDVQKAADEAQKAADDANAAVEQAQAELEEAQKNYEDLKEQADTTDLELIEAQKRIYEAEDAVAEAQKQAESAMELAEATKQALDELELDALWDMVPYYCLSDDPDNPPSDEAYDDTAYAAIFTLGVSILGNTENSSSWTTERLKATEEKQYVWMRWRKVYIDGRIVWTDPELVTDAYLHAQWAEISVEVDKIGLQVGEVYDDMYGEYGKIAQIEMTVDNITSSVTSMSNDMGTLTEKVSTVEQLADSISQTVQTIEGDYVTKSNLTQTSEEIYAEIDKLSGDVYSYVDMTAESLEVVINDWGEGLASQITQTNDSLQTQIYDLNNFTTSSITQLADEIGLAVSELNGLNLNGVMDMVVYYMLGDDPEKVSEPYDDTAYADCFTLGVSILGNTTNSSGWTTTRPTTTDKLPILWVAFKLIYRDGSVKWTEPVVSDSIEYTNAKIDVKADEIEAYVVNWANGRFSTIDATATQISTAISNFEGTMESYVVETINTLSIGVESGAGGSAIIKLRTNSDDVTEGRNLLLKTKFTSVNTSTYYYLSDFGKQNIVGKAIRFRIKARGSGEFHVTNFLGSSSSYFVTSQTLSTDSWAYFEYKTTPVGTLGSNPRVYVFPNSSSVEFAEAKLEIIDDIEDVGTSWSPAPEDLEDEDYVSAFSIDVREYFANSDSVITVGAGLIQFTGGTITIDTNNFTLDAAGNIWANNAYLENGYFHGEIRATSGYIGNSSTGWTISASALYNGCTGINDSSNNGIYMGARDGSRWQSGSNYVSITASVIENGDSVRSVQLTSGALVMRYGNTQYGEFDATTWVDVTNNNKETGDYGISMNVEYATDYIAFGRKESSNASIYTTSYVINYGINQTSLSGYRHIFTGAVNIQNSTTLSSGSTGSLTVASDVIVGGSVIGDYFSGYAQNAYYAENANYAVTAGSATSVIFDNNVGAYHRDTGGTARQFEWLGSDDFFYIGNQTSSGAYWTVRIRGNPTQIYGNNGSTRQLQIYNNGTSGDSGVDVYSWNSGYSVFFGVGTGGTNRGIYDLKNSQWMIYTDSNSYVGINGSRVYVNSPLYVSSTSGVYVNNIQTVWTSGSAVGLGLMNGSQEMYIWGSSIDLEAATTVHGNLILNSTSNGYRVRVTGSSGSTVYLSGNGSSSSDTKAGISDGSYFFCGYGGSNVMLGTDSNHWSSVSIGSSNVSCYIAGYGIYWNGSQWSSSDRSIKNDIQRLDRDDDSEGELLDELDKLEPVEYHLADNSHDDEVHYGYIADDVAEVMPELVREDETGLKYLGYNQIIPLLHLAIKKQNTTIQELTDRIAELESALPKSK